ncbi:hypothetical protein ACFL4E_03815, partial [Candidatus Omnitrophota bacterium]
MSTLLFNYLLLFAMAAAITILVTPTIRYASLRLSLVDKKDQRKIHTKIVARFGGVAVYLGFLFAIITAMYAGFNLDGTSLATLRVVIIASTLVLVLGL